MSSSAHTGVGVDGAGEAVITGVGWSVGSGVGLAQATLITNNSIKSHNLAKYLLTTVYPTTSLLLHVGNNNALHKVTLGQGEEQHW
jgi:hypothetical protein